MSKNKIDKLKKEESKYYKPCINIVDGIKCNGKWFHYKAKEDNGLCKACLKNEKEKSKDIKLGKNRNYIYDCKTIDCGKDLRF